MMKQHRSALGALGLAGAALLVAACATTNTPPSGLYAMPTDLSRALPPSAADPTRAAELAESALFLLNPERPGGPDYLGAARMCLLAVEVADLRMEQDLRRACERVAARSALRSGDRDTYIEAVNRWERSAPRSESVAGELAIHLAIRDRLNGREPGRARIPSEVRGLIPPPEDAP